MFPLLTHGHLFENFDPATTENRLGILTAKGLQLLHLSIKVPVQLFKGDFGIEGNEGTQILWFETALSKGAQAIAPRSQILCP